MGTLAGEIGKVFQRKKTENPTQSTADIMQAFAQNFPGVMQAINSQAAPTAAADLAAYQGVAPGYAQTQSNLYSQYAPQLEEAIAPGITGARANTLSGLNEMLQPGVTGGERSEIERSLNRMSNEQGTLGTPTSTNTVAAAQTYGQAARDRLGQALNLSSQVLPAIKPPGTGAAQFTNAPTSVGQQTTGVGGDFLGQITGLKQQQQDINTASNIPNISL